MSILYVDEIRSKDPNSSNKIDLSGTSVSLQHDEPTADIAVSVADLNTATTPLILPAGMIAPFAIITAPTGWLICDGSAINRTTYARLYSAISETWGPGNSYSSFNIPDLRGWFLRGHDAGAGIDPDASTRAGAVSTLQSGDAVGSIQQNMIHDHYHWVESWYSGGSGHGTGNNNPHNQGYGSGGPYGTNIRTYDISDDTTAANKTYTGGVETRPKNKAVLYCIKY